MNNRQDNLTDKFDFTIIGSGPASLSLALKLEKKGFKIIIFEAGDLYPTEVNQKMYEGNIVGDKYFDLDVYQEPSSVDIKSKLSELAIKN